MELSNLHNNIANCRICADFLPNPPKPIVRFSSNSKILIIGQAPGQRVHDSGISFDDKSGDTLREWLGVKRDEFYDTDNFAIIPIGFCYPGKGKNSGDAPPRKECAPQWHNQIIFSLKNVRLTILIGSFAIDYYLKSSKKRNLTETVRNFEEYYDTHFPIVHPSGLNFRWQAQNPWFKLDVVPILQLKIKEILLRQ
jgi:uracil-DNA glycosylase family 4